METALYILLTIALVSRPTICTPAPKEANSDEGREQTQIDQLYQIYKATQNNIIQLNTEVSLINDQLAELREKSASKSKVDDDLSHLSSTVKSSFRKLLTDFQHLENEVEVNISRKLDLVEVHAVTDSLQSSLSSLNTANGATTTQLNSLQSSVNSLTTQVNSLSPVNLFQNCIQETRSCTMRGNSSPSYYTRSCFTSPLPINITGYYTTDIRCDFDINFSYFETAVLCKEENTIQCACDVARISSLQGSHGTLSQFLLATCTMVITRCPTSM